MFVLSIAKLIFLEIFKKPLTKIIVYLIISDVKQRGDKIMDIIKELRLKRGITQTELANLCGVHQTAVSQWEKGRTLPDKQTLVKLSEIFDVSTDLLMGVSPAAKKNLIPVLGCVRAGKPIGAYEDVLDYVEISDEMAATGDYFGLRVVGDSMEPKICNDDVVIVHKQDYIENGEVGVILINDLDATVKKVIKKGTSLTLVPFNSSYEPMIFSPEEIVTMPVKIIGKVVELRRSFA